MTPDLNRMKPMEITECRVMKFAWNGRKVVEKGKPGE